MISNQADINMNSALFWLTAIVPVAIIAIGMQFILSPAAASAGYGVPITDPSAFPFMWVKGIRDIFAAVIVLVFLARGNRHVTGTIFAIATFIAIGDGFVIIGSRGFAPPLMMHWGTALYMATVSYFLLRKPNAVKVAIAPS